MPLNIFPCNSPESVLNHGCFDTRCTYFLYNFLLIWNDTYTLMLTFSIHDLDELELNGGMFMERSSSLMTVDAMCSGSLNVDLMKAY